ncbi:MAG: anti-phage defense ZorAB system ZorA [Candidatus Cloacimonetes bacterium]|nr:anti-phage defense ZorAB system ZorA [Candidatus Cloacimonadota bacterium]
MSIQFNFKEIWPDIGAGIGFVFYQNTDSQSLMSFSSFWVLLIWTFFVISLAWYGRCFYRSRYRIQYFSKVILADLTKDNIFDMRLRLRDRFTEQETTPKSGRILGDNQDLEKIWQEFDESLVVDQEKQAVRNTLEAHLFFHADNLSQSFLNSRGSGLIPSVLTGLGVLGTFIGLTQGLAGIDLAQESTIEELRQGISAMINGANVAFMTSLWGVTLSLCFGFMIKAGESLLHADLSGLQTGIDYLFPRQTAEFSLMEIARSSEKALNLQSKFAEEISNSLQESVKDATKEISLVLRDSLKEIVTPVFKEISNQVHSSSQDALSHIVDEFVSGISQKTTDQADMMNKASNKINDTITLVSQKLEDLTVMQKSSLEQDLERQNNIHTMLENATNRQVESHTRLFAHLEEHSLSQHKVVQDLENLGKGYLNSLAEQASQTKAEQKKMFDEFALKVSSVISGFRGVVENLSSVEIGLKNSSQSFEGASSRLTDFSQVLGDFVDNLSQHVQVLLAGSNATTDNLDKQIQSLSKILTLSNQLYLNLQTIEKIIDDTSSLNRETSIELGRAAQEVMVELQRTVAGFEENLVSAMNVYGEKVKEQMNDRMTEWNQQTRDFCNDMVTAMKSMQDLIDDLETSLGRQGR